MRKKRKVNILASLLFCILVFYFLSGCVRMAGTAGYWKTDPDGELKTKSATFDTADYVPGGSAASRITTTQST